MPNKAIVVNKLGPPESLSLEEVKIGKPRYGQVKVQVHAAGVNFPDTLIIQGKYQFKPSLPFIPGGEMSGEVIEVGEGVDEFKVGDKVMGMQLTGGFSQQLNCDVPALVKIPDSMDYVTASGFQMTYGTSIHGLKNRANLQAGETVLILGASGGVGMAALEISKAMGAKVIACCSTQEKLDICKSYGADYLINYETENLKKRVKEITNGEGVDVVYDPVGDRFAEPAMRSMAWKGRYLVIGFAAGDIPKIPLNLALLKGCSIVGVFWGKFTAMNPELNLENMELLFKWHAEKKLKPLVSQTYPLSDVPKALNDLLNRNVKGKAVILTDVVGTPKI